MKRILVLLAVVLSACAEPQVDAETTAAQKWLVECYVGGDVVFSRKYADVDIRDTGIFVPNQAGEMQRLDGNCRAIIVGKALP